MKDKIKKYSTIRFEEVKDNFEWKIIPNFSQYVINQYGDIFNRFSGAQMRVALAKKVPNNCVPLVRDDGVLSAVSFKKQIRDLFGIGYIRQEQILVEKYPTYLLAQSFKRNV